MVNSRMGVLMKTFLCSVFLLSFAIYFGCSSSTGPEPTTGVLSGTVRDAQTKSPLSGVRIVIFDANTNAPVGQSLFTSGAGVYTATVEQGTYYVKFYKQGYENLPPKDISPLPVNVPRGQTVGYSVELYQSQVADAGLITGRVTAGGSPVSGVLVTASDTAGGSSSVSDASGTYYIYNLIPRSYTVKAWIAGYNSTDTTVVVSANGQLSDINLRLEQGGGSVKGRITFLATANIEVDVSLTNPGTGETIPGLSTVTAGENYILNNVPAGAYLARATFVNDGKVMDPDWIMKNGEPFVTATGDTVTRDFSVTGSIELTSPTNPSNSTQPVEVADSLPAFTWGAYPSADDYVVEVINSNGKVIWGGFSTDWTVKKVSVHKPQTTVRFNADTTATEHLVAGKVYRWKIYVSKDDSGEPTGWKLISSSEDQRGIFKIVHPL